MLLLQGFVGAKGDEKGSTEASFLSIIIIRESDQLLSRLPLRFLSVLTQFRKFFSKKDYFITIYVLAVYSSSEKFHMHI